MGYSKEIIKGISWMAILRGSTRVLALIKIFFIARILDPLQFGVFGVASLTLSLLEILTETGINAFLIQQKEDVKVYLNTAWVVSIFRGVFISFILFLSAEPISIFFNSPDSIYLLRLICLTPLIRGFINPSQVKFQKNLEFRKEYFFRFSVFISDAFISIYLAYIYRTSICFIWGMTFAAIIEVVLSFLLINPRPSFTLKLGQLRFILNRGKWITLSGIFEYLFQNFDNIVIGKLLGTYYLGMYQMAYKIATLPVSEGGEVLQKVTFPFFVKISEDNNRTKKAFIKIIVLTMVFAIPFGIIVIIFTKDLVLLFLGNKWTEIIPVLRILALLGIVKSIFSSSFALFLANKKQEYITIISFVAFCILTITIYPLIRFEGLLGAGTSALLGWLVAIPFVIIYLRKLL